MIRGCPLLPRTSPRCWDASSPAAVARLAESTDRPQTEPDPPSQISVALSAGSSAARASSLCFSLSLSILSLSLNLSRRLQPGRPPPERPPAPLANPDGEAGPPRRRHSDRASPCGSQPVSPCTRVSNYFPQSIRCCWWRHAVVTYDSPPLPYEYGDATTASRSHPLSGLREVNGDLHESRQEKMSVRRTLQVCTENMCYSPTTKHNLKTEEEKRWRVE